MHLAGFIPCYRCPQQVARVLAALASEQVKRFEVIYVVDNASDDLTADFARSAIEARADKDKFKFIRWPENRGLGGSFKAVFSKARDLGMTHLLMFHGDDQADGNDIPRLLEVAERNQVSAVLGSRFACGARRSGYSTGRLIGNWLFNILYSILLRRKITDIGSGLNLYQVESFSREFIAALPTHIAFDAHILFYLHRRRLSFEFVPIVWRTQDQQSSVRNFEVGWLALKETTRLALGRRHA